jgi:hypothetical protein
MPTSLPGMIERFLVRVLMAIALSLALLAFAFAPVPVDAKGRLDLPAFAFEQPGLYRMEVALLVFYGNLLLVTPALSGLIRGRLPIEISARGARFAEEADQSVARGEAAIRDMEETAGELDRRLTDAQLEIKRLNEITGSDSKQPEVDLKR